MFVKAKFDPFKNLNTFQTLCLKCKMKAGRRILGRNNNNILHLLQILKGSI